VSQIHWSDPLMQRKDEENLNAPLGVWLRKKAPLKGFATLDALRTSIGRHADRTLGSATFYDWFRSHVAAVPSHKYQTAIEAVLELNREERAEFRDVVMKEQQEAADAVKAGAPVPHKRRKSSGTMRAVRVDEPELYPSRDEAIELARGKVDEEVLRAISRRRLKSDEDPGREAWLREIIEAQRKRDAIEEEIKGLKPILPSVGEDVKGKKR
jgi:hypothetical protein